jgi:hypothetical protein
MLRIQTEPLSVKDTIFLAFLAISEPQIQLCLSFFFDVHEGPQPVIKYRQSYTHSHCNIYPCLSLFIYYAAPNGINYT